MKQQQPTQQSEVGEYDNSEGGESADAAEHEMKQWNKAGTCTQFNRLLRRKQPVTPLELHFKKYTIVAFNASKCLARVRLHSLRASHLTQGVIDFRSSGEWAPHVMNSQDVNDALELRSKNLCWIISLFLLTSSPGILNSMHINSYVFLAESPHTWCKVPPLIAANWTAGEIRTISSTE
ncbi:unnamed protein product [Nesidiocoris tenuis]|uniref:Uncharacterized protein n=1 Tax=Nesidiocoris tenuis TaxID=355587 RepID=A0A6H5H1T3_9HEMI|nr:unnamed protein product [Nesidiocoris tenuis]